MTQAAARSRVGPGVSAVILAVLGAGYFAQPLQSQATGLWAVSAWLTTVDRQNLLTAQPALSFAADAGSDPLTIDVDPSTTYQQMDGAGASLTDSSAWLLFNKLSSARRHDLLVKLFDPAQGIGLKVLRLPVGSSDFALSRYTYDDVPAGQADPGLARFSIDHDRAYILPVVREALAVNPQLRIIAAPWSAPAWMKSSGSLIGGTLNASAESSYADYLVRFIQAYADAGVPIHRISPQNEPGSAPSDYPGMLMGASQQAEFIGNHLGPALAASGLDTRIDVWEHNWNNTSYAPSVFANAAAAPVAAGSAWHCYAGTASAMTTVRNQYPDKEVRVTECSGGDWQANFAEAFRQDMDGLVIAAPRNWSRTVVKWNLALDTNHGPHTGGCTNCTGLVTIDQAAGVVRSFNYDYYSLGHLAKFLAPGAVRVASNTFGSSSIEDVAFRNPDGSRVLVVFNADASASHGFKVREGARAFSYALPSLAAVTFTWTDTGAPANLATNLALRRPASASSTETASYPAANGVDGSGGTRWASAYSSAPQWLRVDLGARYSLATVALNWEQAFAAAYQLQVSDDGSTWRTVYATTAGRGGMERVSLPAGSDGRYLRLLCTERTYVYGQQWGYSLWELQAFGTLAPTAPPPDSTTNLALNRPASASSRESTGYGPANAVDGSGATRWGSAFSSAPQWIQVDLGSRRTLSRVVLNWELAFAVAYQVQVSDDAAAWSTVYSTGAGHGGNETLQLSPGATGRYLRLLCTERTYVYGSQWGYSLWELQAFGG